MRVAAYKPGTPCWVDLSTPDLAATTAFFRALFGWEAVEGPPDTGYVIFTVDGAAVAGAGSLLAPDQPPAWTTYLSTDDLAATATRVEAAGGGVLLPPADVMGIGRAALFADPGGAAIGAWEKINFAGAGIVNEPGALTWNELITRDVEGSKAFYRAAFGLGSAASQTGGASYTEFTVGSGGAVGDSVGGGGVGGGGVGGAVGDSVGGGGVGGVGGGGVGGVGGGGVGGGGVGGGGVGGGGVGGGGVGGGGGGGDSVGGDGGGIVAGMMPMVEPQWPADLPPHWMVYFAVDDCDTAAAHVTKLGGSISVPPMDIGVGRMAVVTDPHGAFFTVVKVTTPD